MTNFNRVTGAMLRDNDPWKWECIMADMGGIEVIPFCNSGGSAHLDELDAVETGILCAEDRIAALRDSLKTLRRRRRQLARQALSGGEVG